MNPLVSILIPVYNRENLVGETIESAINQTYKNIEIIIVDNSSTDNTWQVLEHYAALDNRIHLFKNKENVGPVRNWKRCIDEAKGEYSKILFSDDLISENFIEETLSLFCEKTAFVISNIEVLNSKRKSKYYSKYISEQKYLTKNYFDDILLLNKKRFPVSPGAAIFRTNDLKNNLEIEIPNPLEMDFKKYGAGNDLLLFLNIANKYEHIKIAKQTKAFLEYTTTHSQNLIY